MHLDEAFGERVREIGCEDASGDGVDGDAEVRRFTRETFGETDHRRFRRGVVDGGRERANRAD